MADPETLVNMLFESDVLQDQSAEETPTDAPTEDPNATEPGVTEPETTEPDETQPEETEPEATEPDETQPKETEPEATEPDALYASWSTLWRSMTSFISIWSISSAQQESIPPWLWAHLPVQPLH